MLFLVYNYAMIPLLNILFNSLFFEYYRYIIDSDHNNKVKELIYCIK